MMNLHKNHRTSVQPSVTITPIFANASYDRNAYSTKHNPKADDAGCQLEPVDLSLKSLRNGARGQLRLSLSNYPVIESNTDDSEVVDLSLKRPSSTSPGRF
jgi:hypothetical protein